jgi:uncharacterized repeat protein (TIGR01451 family)
MVAKRLRTSASVSCRLGAESGRELEFLSHGEGGGVRHAVFILGLILVTDAATAACPNFGAPVSYSAGTYPLALTTADFNRDGHADIAIATFNSSIVVRLGDGTGAFGAPASIALTFGANGIAAGDFNRDGKTDLAVSGGLTNYAIAIGDGSGGFATPVTHSTGPSPTAITTADFNRDGKLDLLTLHESQNDAYVLLGVGDGTFSAPTEILTGTQPLFAAVADVSGDGIPDIAIANRQSGDVSVYIGVGDGSFPDPVPYGVGGAPTHIGAGDFDGDGDLDLAMSRGIPLGAMLLNNGDGTFAAYYETGSSGDWNEVVDLNGDGALDLATSRSTGVTMDIGNGAGSLTFFGTEFFVHDPGPRASAMADFNHDGLPDLAFLHKNLDNTMSVLLNTSRCSANCVPVDTAVRLTIGTGPAGLDTGDFNRDGRPDLVTANGASTNVSLLRGNASGFDAASNTAVSVPPETQAIADMNGDGKLDVVFTASNYNTVSILSGNGAGGFTENAIAAGFSPHDAAIADFNRDGRLDLALSNMNALAIVIWINNGGGTFTSSTVFGSTAPFALTTGDFDNDGDADLAYASNSNTNVFIRLGNGAGGFGAATPYPAGTAPRAIAVADFNRDGKLDLAVVNIAAAPGVSILLGNGAGAFGAPTAYATPQGATAVKVADWNRDGNPDLAVVNGQVIRLLAGSASGAFTFLRDYTMTYNPAAVVAGDFNRDGEIDMAVANGSSPSGFSNVAVLSTTCLSPELTVNKSHTGNFTQGQTGATYTMVVTNSGTAATAGTVSVVDSPPSSLIPTALGGSGWSCQLATLTCTRADSLAIGASYPAITLTASLSSNAPASIGNAAAVAGGGDLNPDNNSDEDPATVNPNTTIAPTRLVATAQSASQVDVTWDAVTGATLYRITRTRNGSFFQDVSPTASYTDLSVAPNTSYVYQVAVAAGGPDSNKDLATTMIIASPLGPAVRATDFAELRTAVDLVRSAAGLGATPFTDVLTAGGVIKAIHLTQLRSYLDEARLSLGVSTLTYTDPVVTPGATVIKGAHITELRDGVK